MHKSALRLMLVAASTLLAACGQSGGSHRSMDTMHGSRGVEKNRPVVRGAPEFVIIGENFGFTPSEIRVNAGSSVTLALRAADIEHDITVKGLGHIVHAAGGKTARGGLKIITPGKYLFYCSVPGHRAEGMTGTIFVS